MGAADRFNVRGRVALVTGASSGLGLHFAEVLAEAGAHLVLAARRIDRLETVAAQIRTKGGKASAVALDVKDPASVMAAFDAAEAAAGTPVIVVNNAGVTEPAFFTEMTETQWRNVIDVNLDGVFRVAQEAARRMKAKGTGGSIINIASILGLGVLKALVNYAASKAGVIHMSKAMALELARDGIRVNVVAPGYFCTDFNEEFLASKSGQKLISRIPMARAGTLAELDGALMLLASDAGSFMTGSVLVVDGGHSMAMG